MSKPRPVPIVLSRRDEAIDVSHAPIRAATGILALLRDPRDSRIANVREEIWSPVQRNINNQSAESHAIQFHGSHSQRTNEMAQKAVLYAELDAELKAYFRS
ncbi:hypothetical protein DdX_21747 [Ditylenchus destructor]|uniref:Uncharacterized protein n=1 Tax=Ditylenchus destructor TaxID=166010 RepID=A0AAD4QVE5_9BILA|nr:hypothetical protein DdX_21747 [Ditylenchus destructor]